MKLISNFLTVFLFLGVVTYAQNSNTATIDYNQQFNEAKKAYQMFESNHGHFIQTSNVNMHYSTWGNPKHTPFIWIHGTYQNSMEILEIVDQLVDNKLYVIAIDYYGHGLTEIPDKEVSIYNVADDINTLLNHLDISKTIVGGLSRGGTIASAFYDSYPEYVLGLVLEDGGSANWLRPRQELKQEQVVERYTKMYQHRRDTVFDSQFEAYKYYYDDKDLSNQYWLLAYIKANKDNKWAMNIGLSEWLEESSLEESLDGIFRPTLCTLFKSSTLFLEPKIVFRNLDVPILIIDPTLDDKSGFMALNEQNKQLKQMHPQLITHLTYEDATHMAHYQKPERFVADVLKFVNKEILKRK